MRYHLFRAINPGVENPFLTKVGIVVGDKGTFQEYRQLYKGALKRYNILHGLPVECEIDTDANKLADMNVKTFLSEVRFEASRNIEDFPLITAVDSKEDMKLIYASKIQFLSSPFYALIYKL